MKYRIKKFQDVVCKTKPKDLYKKHLAALDEEYKKLTEENYINEHEAMTIRALIALTSYKHNISEEVVCAIMEEHLHVEEIGKLHRHHYQGAVTYMVDFDPEKIMN